jgi:mRNA interferase MazF
MQALPSPSDEEIRAAYAEGQEAVAALIQRALVKRALYQRPRRPLSPQPGQRKEIHQGDLYWVTLEDEGAAHPQVVLQDDVFNRSRIHTVVVCGLTSNRKRGNLPGNVLLDAGEANLTRPSVVEVSKVTSIAKTQLGEYIGTLSPARVEQILAGMRFLQALTERPADADNLGSHQE